MNNLWISQELITHVSIPELSTDLGEQLDLFAGRIDDGPYQGADPPERESVTGDRVPHRTSHLRGARLLGFLDRPEACPLEGPHVTRPDDLPALRERTEGVPGAERRLRAPAPRADGAQLPGGS